MKKIILAVAIAGLAISCQKIQAGSNKGVLKMQPGVEHYTDDVMSDEATAAFQAAEAKKASEMMSTDSANSSNQPATAVQKDSTQEVKAPAAAPTTETK